MAVIDLSQLPAPQIVDVPDFETLLAERKAEFVALHPKDEQEAVIRTLELESEPVTKLLQENAYRELLLRQRINEAAQAVMVAYAMGSDLDQLAANYNVKRLTVTPADNNAVPPVAAVMESDEALRLRVPAAFEGLSVAGPTAAYEFHARSADGRVADASATSPAPAEVVLTVLSREGDGTAEKDLLDVVEKALNSENVRPVADRLTVRSAEIIPYRVEATIFLYGSSNSNQQRVVLAGWRTTGTAATRACFIGQRRRFTYCAVVVFAPHGITDGKCPENCSRCAGCTFAVWIIRFTCCCCDVYESSGGTARWTGRRRHGAASTGIWSTGDAARCAVCRIWSVRCSAQSDRSCGYCTDGCGAGCLEILATHHRISRWRGGRIQSVGRSHQCCIRTT